MTLQKFKYRNEILDWKQNIFRKQTQIYTLFVPFAITDSRFGISFVVTGFVCLQVTEAVHFFFGAFSEHANAFASVHTRVFVCV